MKICEVKNTRIGEGMPKICVPLIANTLEDIMQETEQLKNYPIDIVEWRIDLYQDIRGSSKILHALQQIRETLTNYPLICTFRTTCEGGNRVISTNDYVKLNTDIITSGKTDIIDIELSQGEEAIAYFIALAKKHNVKVLLSHHDFRGTPTKEEIVHCMLRMQNLGCDLAKIAVTPRTKMDVLTLLDATATMHEEHATVSLVTISMHEKRKN
jgi:3-dehydroquinate dehydratase, type I